MCWANHKPLQQLQSTLAQILQVSKIVLEGWTPEIPSSDVKQLSPPPAKHYNPKSHIGVQMG